MHAIRKKKFAYPGKTSDWYRAPNSDYSYKEKAKGKKKMKGRPTKLHDKETAPVKKVEEHEMDAAKMGMLRWMCGVAREDRRRIINIRGTVKVTEALN